MSLGTWQNPFGPGALNNLIFFTVQNNATFSCASIGSRCSFTTSDFGRIDEDGGAIADQEGGSVWTTNNTAVDVLNLQLCKTPPCLAACFNDCSCSYPDGSPCTQTSAPPTPAPTKAPTPVVAPKNCAMKKNQQMCPEIATSDALRAGQQCDYCYNFCNGKFLGCCTEDGECYPANAECTADDVTGEINEVFGCDRIYEAKSNGDNNPSNGGDNNPNNGDQDKDLLASWAVKASHSSLLVGTLGALFLLGELN